MLRPSQINIPLYLAGDIPHDVTVIKQLAQKSVFSTAVLIVLMNLRVWCKVLLIHKRRLFYTHMDELCGIVTNLKVMQSGVNKGNTGER
jgi:hypothetical protein